MAADAVLLVSELVTNAIQAHQKHQRQRDPQCLELVLTVFGGTLRIEVHDSASGSYPVLDCAGADAETGRGLQVVAALAVRWGSRNVPGGKVVWCDLSMAGQPADPVGPTDPRLIIAAALAR